MCDEEVAAGGGELIAARFKALCNLDSNTWPRARSFSFPKTRSITESLTSPGQAGDGDDQLGRFDGLGNVNLKT